jgi:hypothetical protein
MPVRRRTAQLLKALKSVEDDLEEIAKKIIASPQESDAAKELAAKTLELIGREWQKFVIG